MRTRLSIQVQTRAIKAKGYAALHMHNILEVQGVCKVRRDWDRTAYVNRAWVSFGLVSM